MNRESESDSDRVRVVNRESDSDSDSDRVRVVKRESDSVRVVKR